MKNEVQRNLKGFQGIFLDEKTEEKLINLQKDGLENNIKNMHITFKYGDIEEYPNEIMGKEYKIKIVGYGSDGKNSGFLVEIPQMLKNYYKSSSLPHVTVSLGEVDGVKGKAVDTGKLDFKPLDEKIQIIGKLGYFIYGKGKCIDNQAIEEHKKENMPKNVKILIVPKYMSQEELSKESINPVATVEAEYGEKIIRGTEITLAHHIKEYENNPAPCNTPNIPMVQDNSIIVVSHLDLDTLGGIAALIGRKKENPKFWQAAEFIDLNGAHNLFQVEEGTRKKYIAYKAYQDNHRIQRFTEITDVTNIVLEHLYIIDKIIDGDKYLIQEGIKWDEEIKKKIEDCLVFENDNVRIFDSPEGVFCSASYYSEKMGKVIPTTVTRNGKFKSLTIAMADGGKKVSAKELVQELWGSEAGGHPGIAGSPRGKEMTEKDMKKLARLVNERYNKINEKDEIIYFEIDGASLDD